ncbi:hypothetical protein KOW79_014063 [Hemibagrus wyckioides]|uniref:Uncharacterized protein n=1 Tax=Hemibagrus wyckioides TaxID=337641 RepID=A0A9D3SFU9_9TELE|nr:hypothetical protein KOW79_014063 [Hemibagrus wyckioides]
MEACSLQVHVTSVFGNPPIGMSPEPELFRPALLDKSRAVRRLIAAKGFVLKHSDGGELTESHQTDSNVT